MTCAAAEAGRFAVTAAGGAVATATAGGTAGPAPGRHSGAATSALTDIAVLPPHTAGCSSPEVVRLLADRNCELAVPLGRSPNSSLLAD